MFLLSMKAGLRAKEIASLTWAMVTDATGQIAEAIQLQNRASKGTTGGRTWTKISGAPRGNAAVSHFSYPVGTGNT